MALPRKDHEQARLQLGGHASHARLHHHAQFAAAQRCAARTLSRSASPVGTRRDSTSKVGGGRMVWHAWAAVLPTGSIHRVEAAALSSQPSGSTVTISASGSAELDFRRPAAPQGLLARSCRAAGPRRSASSPRSSFHRPSTVRGRQTATSRLTQAWARWRVFLRSQSSVIGDDLQRHRGVASRFTMGASAGITITGMPSLRAARRLPCLVR